MSQRWLLIASLLLAGCRSAPELVAEGDALMAQKQYAEAGARYTEVLNRSGVSDLDRRRAAIGEAQSYLYRGDLTGAETRLRRMPDNVSAKWYHLGEVALGRKNPDEARKAFQRALDLVHGGDTARRLAGLIAGEARSPVTIVRAAEVFKRGGGAQEAAQLGTVAEVWRGLEAGVDPKDLMGRLEPVVAGPVGAYPSVRVLRARLLARLGKPDPQAWALEQVSAEFRRWATELRAQEAIERGDQASLTKLLEQVDPVTAARIRDRVARSLVRRGDFRGALARYRETARGKGEPALAAAAEAARLLERLGRKAEAEAAWKRALTATKPSPRLRLRLGRHLARRGDLLGGAKWLGASSSWPAEGRTHAERITEAARLLERALEAYQDGARTHATAAARATRTLVPGEPAASAILAGGKLEAAAGVRGATRIALRRSILTRLLRTGAMKRASALLRESAAATFRVVVNRELYRGVLAALRAGQDDQVQAFLRQHAALLETETLRAAAALAPYPSALLAEPRGVLAVGARLRWGSLWAERSGFRWSLVGLERVRDGLVVRFPGGGALKLANAEALARSLGGGAARRLGWEPSSNERVAERVGAARAGGAEVLEPLEIE